jgi:DNA-binding NarL/FixJ family response regulator
VTAGIGGKIARILVVDDHPAVCEGLTYRISAQPDMAVCGRAAEVTEALRKIAELDPHLVIVDVGLRNSDGLELIKAVKHRHRSVRTLVHSMHDESFYADRCLRAGAMGYVNKEADPSEVIDAIRAVLSGRVYLSPWMTSQLLGRTVNGPSSAHPVETLTDRQLEVFRLIAEGLTAAQIAESLFISVHTVETHRENIKRKLNVKTAGELTRLAVLWSAESKSKSGRGESPFDAAAWPI